jgi:hypothetical protein
MWLCVLVYVWNSIMHIHGSMQGKQSSTLPDSWTSTNSSLCFDNTCLTLSGTWPTNLIITSSSKRMRSEDLNVVSAKLMVFQFVRSCSLGDKDHVSETPAASCQGRIIKQTDSKLHGVISRKILMFKHVACNIRINVFTQYQKRRTFETN